MKNIKTISLFVSLTALTSCHLANEIKEGTQRTMVNVKDASYYLFTNKTPVEEIYYKEARRKPAKNPAFGNNQINTSPAQLDKPHMQPKNDPISEFALQNPQFFEEQINNPNNSQFPPQEYSNNYNQKQSVTGSTTEELNYKAYQTSKNQAPKNVKDGFDYTNTAQQGYNPNATFPLDNYAPQQKAYAPKPYRADYGGVVANNPAPSIKPLPKETISQYSYEPRNFNNQQLSYHGNFPDLRDVPVAPKAFKRKDKLQEEMQRTIETGRQIDSKRNDFYPEIQQQNKVIENSKPNLNENLPWNNNNSSKAQSEYENLKKMYEGNPVPKSNNDLEKIKQPSFAIDNAPNNFSSSDPFYDSKGVEIKTEDISDFDNSFSANNYESGQFKTPKKSFFQRIFPFSAKSSSPKPIKTNNNNYSFFGDDEVKTFGEDKPQEQPKKSLKERFSFFGKKKEGSEEKRFNIEKYGLPISFDKNRVKSYDKPKEPNIQPLNIFEDGPREQLDEGLNYQDYTPKFSPDFESDLPSDAQNELDQILNDKKLETSNDDIEDENSPTNLFPFGI